MKTKLEYMVKDSEGVIATLSTRSEARELKRELMNDWGIKSKIVQNVWTLNKQKQIR